MKAQATMPRRTRPGNAEPERNPWFARALIVMILVAVTAALALAYHELTRPGSLPLRVIEIKGEFRHLDAAAIERTVSASIDGGFFTCDLPRLRAAVLAMPWVEEVSIRRVWPDRLRMQVSEQIPLARWGDDALVNVHAQVFRPPSLEGYESLVRLSGPDGSEHRVVEFLQAGLAPARARGLAIREVRLDERRHWWLVFDDGLTLSLGRENVARRLDEFYRVYPGLVAYRGQPPVRVDMRYANGLAVRWAEPDNTPPAGGQSGEKV
jgi:cell division protein FtsQ